MSALPCSSATSLFPLPTLCSPRPSPFPTFALFPFRHPVSHTQQNPQTRSIQLCGVFLFCPGCWALQRNYAVPRPPAFLPLYGPNSHLLLQSCLTSSRLCSRRPGLSGYWENGGCQAEIPQAACCPLSAHLPAPRLIPPRFLSEALDSLFPLSSVFHLLRVSSLSAVFTRLSKCT